MLGNLGFGEILAIVLLGLLVFGPDKLPGLARDAARLLGELRRMATGAREELREQLGPEVADMAMDPRRAVQRALWDDPSATGTDGTGRSAAAPVPSRSGPSRSGPSRSGRELRPGELAPFDPDST